MDDSALDNDILGMNVLPFLLGHFGKHLVTNGGIINIRFGRLMMPTIRSSRTTGTRLILLVSRRVAMSASSVVSLTEITSRVMMLSTVRPCDLT